MPNRPLETYETKRDFSRTAEPRAREVPRTDGVSLRFVVQKHDARRLHFDLRLELDGVLKSWAVMRGPSLDPAEKRLAVRTEDHPIAYETFEGTLPKGDYGGGTELVWDSGTWEPKGDPRRDLETGVLKFELRGLRLKGGFALVRLGRKSRELRENWLLIKERDAAAVRKGDVTERWRTSVASGRSIEAVASGVCAKRETKRGRRTSKRRSVEGALGKTEDKDPHRGRTTDRSSRLRMFAPQFATLVTSPPEGDDWLHEIKYDGYRVLAEKSGRTVRLYTRSGLDWTHAFRSIADAVRRISAKEAVLDGEVVVFDPAGRSSFGLLQASLRGGDGAALSYVVFDILLLGGRNLRREPLFKRKAMLERTLRRAPEGIVLGEAIAGSGGELYRNACKLGLEGLVSKRRDSAYASVRSTAWLKCKCKNRNEFVIVGFRPSKSRGRTFSSLLVGDYDEDRRLVYRGRVGSGFGERELETLTGRLLPLVRPHAAVQGVPKAVAKAARWVEPKLVAEISYAELTSDDVLRHPVFVGLRNDKPAREVSMRDRQKLEVVDEASARHNKRERPITCYGVRLTHPSRILFRESGATKADLARYYAAVAEVMLPHIRKRPLSFLRCPEGSFGDCFFQKHARAGLPRELSVVPVREKAGTSAKFVGIDTRAGLVAAAQVGAIELHIWGSRSDDLERPDRLLIDLDPDEGLPHSAVRTAAFDVRDIFEAAGLKSFALLTGGKGVHVIAPIERRHTWDEVKMFTQGVAGKLASSDPSRFVVTMAKAKRKGRIFLDYLRNERGATGIAPYSVRAKDRDSVAMPVSWDELSRASRSSLFSMADAIAQLDERPWADYFSIRQRISAKAMAFFT